jgi:CRP-like cAMP-binding protein
MKPKRPSAFNAQAFLDSSGIARKVTQYRRAEVIFTQGDPCDHVLYIQKGAVSSRCA